MKYKCLSIAGFDGSGGAGLQADLKTFSAFGCYGMTVLTALPVQNTCGVKSCYDIPIGCIKEQLECIFEDIVPDAIKIGMLFSSEIIELVSEFLSKNAKNIPIVLDPVMVAKSGDTLLLPEAIDSLKNKLIPITDIITPNIPEAKKLVGYDCDFYTLAEKILMAGAGSVLLKGGHMDGEESNDLFLDADGASVLLKERRINSKNTHGTGCTLSAAICSCLAMGFSRVDSCKCAKEYLTNAMLASVENSVGKGHGPVHHLYNIWPTIEKPQKLVC